MRDTGKIGTHENANGKERRSERSDRMVDLLLAFGSKNILTLDERRTGNCISGRLVSPCDRIRVETAAREGG